MADKIGKLKDRLEFQSDTTTEGTYGPIHTWSTDFTVWGDVRPNPGLTYDRGDTHDPHRSITHHIIVRKNKEITRNHSIWQRFDPNDPNVGARYIIHRIVYDFSTLENYFTLHVEEVDEDT